MQVTQVHLASGTTRRTCWVPVRPGVRPGSTITLKTSEEPARRWAVLAASPPRDSAGLHTDWKVGGIDFPPLAAT